MQTVYKYEQDVFSKTYYLVEGTRLSLPLQDKSYDLVFTSKANTLVFEEYNSLIWKQDKELLFQDLFSKLADKQIRDLNKLNEDFNKQKISSVHYIYEEDVQDLEDFYYPDCTCRECV